MSAEALLLALFNAGRPTDVAAVYALLEAEKPRRVLPVFIAVGFTWSVLIGVLVVSALHGVKVQLGESTVDAVVSLALGSAAVGFAVGIASGRVEAGGSRRSPTHESRIVRALRSPSTKVVAGAGVLTHLPGVLYLLGLNAISATDPHLVRGV